MIAAKTPELHGALCANHVELCTNSFLGNEVPMDGRVPRAGGKHVKVLGKKGIVYEPSTEEEAFHRWQKGDFLQVERRFAKTWRNTLKSADPSGIAVALSAMGVNPKTCKTFEAAKQMAESFVKSCEAPLDRMNLACIVLGLSGRIEQMAYTRWKGARYPTLADYAPYAAYAVTVALFFHIALAARLLTQADQMDVSYLFYLPFCMIFISSDKLHRSVAPLFLRQDQSFVWGRDLKTDLRRIVEHYLGLPESEKERGIFELVPSPPQDGNGMITSLWDVHMGPWREKLNRPELNPASHESLVKAIKTLTDAPAIPTDEIVSQEEISSMAVHRYIRRRRGSFCQVPKEVDDPSIR